MKKRRSTVSVSTPKGTVEERVRRFDAATRRQRRREARRKLGASPADRGWTREDAYRRPD